MQTRKLFYEDCNLSRFSATVTSCEEAGGRYLVMLDQTAFYPEGGGQACDVGVLGNARVLDVQEKDGKLLHYCDSSLKVGVQVEGEVDFARRFDVMQQHTGEHILSGILHRRYGCQNTGFHVGSDVMEVDFDVVVPTEDLADIEREANEAVWKNVALRCWYPTPEELPDVVYRTKRALPWPVRIVQIPGYDSCACCGIHVAMTGQVGLIKIVSCVKLRGGVRMEVACGARAYRYVAAVCEQNRQVSQAFSAKMLETGSAAEKMNELLAQEKLRNAGLLNKVFHSIAQGYAGGENVIHICDMELDSSQVRVLAERISAVTGGYTAVFAPKEPKGYSYCLASAQVDLTALGKELNAALNGRGGGKPNFQQGSIRASEAEIRAFLEK